MCSSDLMDFADKNQPSPWRVNFVAETGSTNADLLEQGLAGAPDRTVLRAGFQSAGRGRLDRTWQAEPGENLLVSFLFRRVPRDPHVLTQVVAMAAADVARSVGVDAVMKWPNDLLVGTSKLAGVLAHEIGHLSLGHIEKKLIKEVGLTMLFTMAGGNGGQEVIKEVVKTISSSAFDRTYEEEADLFAVQTMNKAGFDPESLSAFMLRMSQQESVPELMVWMNSHPESKARAATILEEAKKIKINKRVVIATPWIEIQKLTN